MINQNKTDFGAVHKLIGLNTKVVPKNRQILLLTAILKHKKI